MFSWHKDRCRFDIVIADGWVHCQYCGNSAPSQEDPTTSSGQTPEEEPCTSLLNLSWPSPDLYEDCVFDEAGNDITKELIDYVGLKLGGSATSSASPHLADVANGFKPIQASDEIRILRLFPGTNSTPLHGELWHATFEERPKFEALSYSWADETGDSSRTERLFIGSSWDILPITINCKRALQRLRDPYEPRDLWIDAVCINQSNSAEQSHQVRLMGKIYSLTHRCLVYLGQSTNSSKVAFAALRHRIEINKLTEADTQAVSELFARPYFSRLWILQELILSPDILVYCGEDEIRWTELRKNIERFPSVTTIPNWVKNFKHIRADALDIPLEKEVPQELSLWKLLNMTSSSYTSDPRDKIFALFGILNRHDIEFQADYSLSMEQVYIGVAAYFMSTTTKPPLWRRSANLESKLPLWVPDWRCISPHEWREQLDPVSTAELHQGNTITRRSNLSWDKPTTYDVPINRVGLVPPAKPGAAIHRATGALITTAFALMSIRGLIEINSSFFPQRMASENGNSVYRKTFNSGSKCESFDLVVVLPSTTLEKEYCLATFPDYNNFFLLEKCGGPNVFKIVYSCSLEIWLPDFIDGGDLVTRETDVHKPLSRLLLTPDFFNNAISTTSRVKLSNRFVYSWAKKEVSGVLWRAHRRAILSQSFSAQDFLRKDTEWQVRVSQYAGNPDIRSFLRRESAYHMARLNAKPPAKDSEINTQTTACFKFWMDTDIWRFLDDISRHPSLVSLCPTLYKADNELSDCGYWMSRCYDKNTRWWKRIVDNFLKKGLQLMNWHNEARMKLVDAGLEPSALGFDANIQQLWHDRSTRIRKVAKVEDLEAADFETTMHLITDAWHYLVQVHSESSRLVEYLLLCKMQVGQGALVKFRAAVFAFELFISSSSGYHEYQRSMEDFRLVWAFQTLRWDLVRDRRVIIL